MLPEITHPVDLCLPSGALNPAATGWARGPLHRANLHRAPLGSRAATWSRTKRREHWGIATESYLIAATVNSLNYAAQHQVWLMRRSDGEVIEQSAIVPLARQVEFPETFGSGPVRALTRDLAIAVDPEGPNTRLRARTPRVRLDLRVDTASQALGVVIPWSDRQFHYTLKAAALPVAGRLNIDDEDVDLGEAALAHVDHGRGRWPYSTSYISAFGSGVVGGARTGLHLGGLWNEGTGASENVLLLDGVLHYLPEQVQWNYDVESDTAPWAAYSDRVDAELEPFHASTHATNLGIVSTTSTQVVGSWRGTIRDDDGTHRSIDGLIGTAEYTSNRW